MVKLVDMPDLGSGAARRVGSSPIIRTFKTNCPNYTLGSFFLKSNELEMKCEFCHFDFFVCNNRSLYI